MRSLREFLAAKGFVKDTDGSILVFVMVVFSAMFLVGGTAVDLARHENLRASLQYNLDRAVLAAASLKQTEEPEVVVNDYMSRFNAIGEFTVNVDSEVNVNSRAVSATADATLDTWFLSMAGIDDMPIRAASAASERIPNLEISLVLDVSGSMRGNKLSSLKTAAKQFITTMLTGTDPDTVTISVVPFNHNSAPSNNMFEALTISQFHTLSTCLNFSDSDFESTSVSPTQSYTQGIYTSDDDQAYYSSYYGYEIYNGSDPFLGLDDFGITCYSDQYFEILPHSANETTLHSKIDSLEADGWTSGHIGIKWGVGLLDPAFQPVVSSLISEGDVSGAFEGLPVAWEDPDTMKIVVMMGDGANTNELQLGSDYTGPNSPLWEVKTEVPGELDYLVYSGYTYQPEWYGPGVLEGYCSWSSTTCYYTDPSEETYYYLAHETAGTYRDVINETNINGSTFDGITVGNELTSGSGEIVLEKNQLDWGVAWGLMSAEYYDEKAGGSSRSELLSGTRGYALSDTAMSDICTAARDSGIVVFTIGYQTGETTSAKLEACATTSAHYYDAATTNIATVFSSIASSIQKLKLTQ